jgi:hypothetical protein
MSIMRVYPKESLPLLTKARRVQSKRVKPERKRKGGTAIKAFKTKYSISRTSRTSSKK